MHPSLLLVFWVLLRTEQVARNAIALDMEASAFLKLCGYAGISSLGVVKGISDFGDSKKGHVPNAYEAALQNTAIALKEWVTHTIPAMNWQLDEGMLRWIEHDETWAYIGAR